jgi:hypothetical protein
MAAATATAATDTSDLGLMHSSRAHPSGARGDVDETLAAYFDGLERRAVAQDHVRQTGLNNETCLRVDGVRTSTVDCHVPTACICLSTRVIFYNNKPTGSRRRRKWQRQPD